MNCMYLSLYEVEVFDDILFSCKEVVSIWEDLESKMNQERYNVVSIQKVCYQ